MTEEVKQVMQAVNELRSTVEGKFSDTADAKAKIEKVQAFLDKQEEVNQKNTRELMETKKREQETAERLAGLEKLLDNTKAAESDKQEAKLELKAYHAFIAGGVDSLGADERKALRVGDDTQGGYLVPADRSNEIIKSITEISALRSLARVTTTTRGVVEIPKRSALLSGGWVGETGSDGLSNSTYGMEKISVNKIQVTVQATHEMLRDSIVSVENEINADVVEAFAQLEGAAFVSGAGSTTVPQGVLTNSSVGYYASGDAAALTADAILRIPGEVKTGYNLAFIMNRRTLATIRTLKRGDGEYLWVPGIGAANPSMIAGLPYAEMPDMPDVAANAYPIAVGDFFRGYRIVDNVNIEMIRDDYTKKREGKVEFTYYKRVGGQVVLAEAIKKLKIAVS